MHIAIAGNIGSGKTTLTRLLARHYGWEPRYETVTDNPYLADYYSDINRWAFPMEVFYLKERFRDMLEIKQSAKDVVQDRTIFEGVYVFARNNHIMGNLDDRDFDTYMELYESMMLRVDYPRLLVYLRTPLKSLVANIDKRGREYERKMPIDYLESLNKLYDDFVLNEYPAQKLIIDNSGLDFEHNAKDLGKIIDQIDAELFGLFTNNTLKP